MKKHTDMNNLVIIEKNLIKFYKSSRYVFPNDVSFALKNKSHTYKNRNKDVRYPPAKFFLKPTWKKLKNYEYY